MDAYEKFAIEQFLSFYPKDKTFVEVLDLILEDDPRVICTFTDYAFYSPQDVYRLIFVMRDDLKKTFKEVI